MTSLVIPGQNTTDLARRRHFSCPRCPCWILFRVSRLIVVGMTICSCFRIRPSSMASSSQTFQKLWNVLGTFSLKVEIHLQEAGHPSCITSRSLLNAGSLNLSLRICRGFIGDAGRFYVIWWMSNCGNSLSGGTGRGDNLERASAMGTSAPFMYFTVTSYFRVRSTNLYNLGGQSLSFFLKIASSGL